MDVIITLTSWKIINHGQQHNNHINVSYLRRIRVNHGRRETIYRPPHMDLRKKITIVKNNYNRTTIL